MGVRLIGVPLWYGCNNPGTEKAYECFKEAGIRDLCESLGHSVSGEVVVPVPEDKDERFDPTMDYLNGTVAACRGLEKAVCDAIAAKDFPLILGGDHALGIGSIAGINHHIPKEDLTVIWVDAHTDINTNETSDSRHIHGMPLAACLGLGSRKLIDGFGKDTVKLLPENLFYLGARSIDDGEKEIIREKNIRCFTMDEVREKGIEAAVKELLSLVKTSYVHLSFDVDFMDGEEYTATGLPVPDGPSIQDTEKCLAMFFDSGKICSMDFVEYSPKNDGKREGLAVCMNLLKTCLSRIEK